MERESYDKENVSCFSAYELTNRYENDPLLKEFQCLKQMNRIIDSNPQSEETKDQKIRSLVVMFKRQLSINKKLSNQLSDFQARLQGHQKQLLFRQTQIRNYERVIFEQKQKLIAVQGENKRLIKSIQPYKEEIKLKSQLIQKLNQTNLNQKYSMENQLLYLKQKAIEHYGEKLNFPIHHTSQRNPTKSQSIKSCDKNSIRSLSAKKSKLSKKRDIIRKNIMAISKKQNQLLSGQNLLKKFKQNKILSDKINKIKKGDYHSTLVC